MNLFKTKDNIFVGLGNLSGKDRKMFYKFWKWKCNFKVLLNMEDVKVVISKTKKVVDNVRGVSLKKIKSKIKLNNLIKK